MHVPYLRAPCFVDGGSVRFNRGARHDLTASQLAILSSVFQGGATLEDLGRIQVEAGEAPDVATAERGLGAAFAQPSNAIGLAEVDVLPEYDVILVEQGYGGVYVHTVELVKKLRRRWKCLLLSPTLPLFEPVGLPEALTLEGLRATQPGLNYFAWFQLVRTIVKRTRCKLLLIAHRSQSLFLFDLLADKKTIIYCDGFFDGAFRRPRDFRLDDSPAAQERVLAEIFYLLGNSNPEFFGIESSPAVNPHLLMAGGFSLRSAIENWCWGARQHQEFAQAFPDLSDSVRLMLPFTNGDLFQPQRVQRDERVLFTTTMHNIPKKGFPELLKAMARLPNMHVRCVVRQPQLLPPIPPGVARRMNIGSVTKSEMIELYHRVWLNCRTSRDESSPLSILEAMVCEVPQIVSPAVAEQIPIIADGSTGFVVDPDDGERLVWALKTLLADRRLRDHMGRACRHRALELTFEKRIDAFERLLA